MFVNIFRMNLDLNLKFCNLTILNNYTNSPHKALSLPTGKFINLSLKIFCFEVLTKEKTFSLQSLENLHFKSPFSPFPSTSTSCLRATCESCSTTSFIISVSQPRHGEGPHSLTDGQLGGSAVGPEQKKCGGQDEDKGVLSLKS